MKGGKRRLYGIAAVVGVFAYQFIFPYPLGKELLAVPGWTAETDAAAGTVQPDPGAKTAGYSLNGHVGYVDAGGAVRFRERIGYGAAVHDEFFISYTALPRNLMVRRADGGFLGTIPGSGYPFIRGERLFLISPEGFALSEWTVNGDLEWESKFPALITTVDAGRSAVAIGFLDGGFRVIGEDGAEIFVSPPAKGNYPVTLQTAVTGDDRYVASVGGIGPQKLSVFEKTGKTYRLLVSRDLSSDFRRPVKGGFFTSSHYFVTEQPGGAGVFDPRSKRFAAVSLPGTVRALAESPAQELLLALTEENGRFFLTAFLPSGKQVMRFGFPRDPSFFLRRSGDDILLGLGARLFHIAVRVG